ncbi:lim and transglutaminase domain protein ltd-1-like [Mercenaria mercenaria]|uniref:lim and transglutaminase domain protein ltd-1-like n=1 Tax=Mercenaria mercenaria TaxID=6596 RepID=UPI00234EB0C1|nr:lim and transglutaminase domain protein ltd-1-like [Mercenaria mercenaria]
MGSGISARPSVIIDPIRVSRTKGKYPPPLAPKWFLPDIRPLVHAPETDDPDSHSIDWYAIERSLETEVEDGVDSDVDTVRIRPLSGIGSNRTDSGRKKIRQAQRHRHKQILSFDAIDQHAKSALPNHSVTFEELIKYLKQPIDEGLHPDTCLVRALTVWLSKQDNRKSKYQHADVTTPNGIIQHLKHQTLSYTEAYTLICRGAGIPTVIITGVVKAGKYKPGDIIDEGARDTWCAVHVDGSWQLVHPFWVCRGTYGKEREGWVQIEDDPFLAEKVARREKQKEKDVFVFNEEFFMPKPEVFIYRCFADDKQWHLIPEEKTLKSVEEFTKLVYISPPFFKFGLSLASNPFCVQPSINGTVIIEIVAPKDHIHALNLGYKIHTEENETQNTFQYKNLLQNNAPCYKLQKQ